MGVNQPTGEGFLYGLAAYGWWGLVPIYFHWLGKISPFDILAHRIVWSAFFYRPDPDDFGALARRSAAQYARNLSRRRSATRSWSPTTGRCTFSPSTSRTSCRRASAISCRWSASPWGIQIFRERLVAAPASGDRVCRPRAALLTWEVGVFPWLATRSPCAVQRLRHDS